MATRNVVLSRHRHELVEELVKSGRFQNASEGLREGLRLVEKQVDEDAAKIALLRRATEQGWSDIESGRYDDIDEQDPGDFMGQLGFRAAGVRPGG